MTSSSSGYAPYTINQLKSEIKNILKPTKRTVLNPPLPDSDDILNKKTTSQAKEIVSLRKQLRVVKDGEEKWKQKFKKMNDQRRIMLDTLSPEPSRRQSLCRGIAFRLPFRRTSNLDSFTSKGESVTDTSSSRTTNSLLKKSFSPWRWLPAGGNKNTEMTTRSAGATTILVDKTDSRSKNKLNNQKFSNTVSPGPSLLNNGDVQDPTLAKNSMNKTEREEASCLPHDVDSCSHHQSDHTNHHDKNFPSAAQPIYLDEIVEYFEVKLDARDNEISRLEETVKETLKQMHQSLRSEIDHSTRCHDDVTPIAENIDDLVIEIENIEDLAFFDKNDEEISWK